ncbi:hypothetical protein B0T24DRAFT_660981 [Lasiosphaeria ovina]|uniref:Uncharacterized protein n=1 Tax=Lasiosphaeria ovina TaxID=92902 RepID=A0AAE0NIP0_9PEZI|nr:hypothetical protein B0T24DRAFT_660981 [Lasiosphaeria ovina]
MALLKLPGGWFCLPVSATHDWEVAEPEPQTVTAAAPLEAATDLAGCRLRASRLPRARSDEEGAVRQATHKISASRPAPILAALHHSTSYASLGIFTRSSVGFTRPLYCPASTVQARLSSRSCRDLDIDAANLDPQPPAIHPATIETMNPDTQSQPTTVLVETVASPAQARVRSTPPFTAQPPQSPTGHAGSNGDGGPHQPTEPGKTHKPQFWAVDLEQGNAAETRAKRRLHMLRSRIGRRGADSTCGALVDTLVLVASGMVLLFFIILMVHLLGGIPAN